MDWEEFNDAMSSVSEVGLVISSLAASDVLEVLRCTFSLGLEMVGVESLSADSVGFDVAVEAADMVVEAEEVAVALLEGVVLEDGAVSVSVLGISEDSFNDFVEPLGVMAGFSSSPLVPEESPMELLYENVIVGEKETALGEAGGDFLELGVVVPLEVSAVAGVPGIEDAIGGRIDEVPFAEVMGTVAICEELEDGLMRCPKIGFVGSCEDCEAGKTLATR
jgi:hypothetical protein